ncbi:hypothetical protein COV20_05610 [Candidatus Woesearchaeota archaeon CG10_big_fil_rev_8_21_14_0_10_45_16]|nr:MAG: hypothetical protein COV20_05610 [Candidatus Woesearchaeota archaeon CG10_big_fil_rev_8_21_14_0_10_45_16]
MVEEVKAHIGRFGELYETDPHQSSGFFSKLYRPVRETRKVALLTRITIDNNPDRLPDAALPMTPVSLRYAGERKDGSTVFEVTYNDSVLTQNVRLYRDADHPYKPGQKINQPLVLQNMLAAGAALKKLQGSPNIVNLIKQEVVNVGGLCVLTVMEDAGRPLGDVYTAFSFNQKLKALRDTIEGVKAIQEQGMWHRDLKPDNILYSRREEKACIGDFGLVYGSYPEDENLRSFLCQVYLEDDLIAGTPMYMAPEQVRGIDNFPNPDRFAVGLIAYELFTEKRDFPWIDPENPTKLDLYLLENHLMDYDVKVQKTLALNAFTGAIGLASQRKYPVNFLDGLCEVLSSKNSPLSPIPNRRSFAELEGLISEFVIADQRERNTLKVQPKAPEEEDPGYDPKEAPPIVLRK